MKMMLTTEDRPLKKAYKLSSTPQHSSGTSVEHNQLPPSRCRFVNLTFFSSAEEHVVAVAAAADRWRALGYDDGDGFTFFRMTAPHQTTMKVHNWFTNLPTQKLPSLSCAPHGVVYCEGGGVAAMMVLRLYQTTNQHCDVWNDYKRVDHLLLLYGAFHCPSQSRGGRQCGRMALRCLKAPVLLFDKLLNVGRYQCLKPIDSSSHRQEVGMVEIRFWQQFAPQ